jgi:UDP-N-acetylmuramyl pentapeptide phosphotransferase/UDP-N-acetylglucosamine-1-phosphate transferase
MRISLKPKTTMGKWSTGLMIAFFLFVAVCLILGALGQGGGDTFFSNLTLGIPGLLAGVSAVSALVTGIICIVKSRERSVLVFLATAIGLYILIIALGEILFPH